MFSSPALAKSFIHVWTPYASAKAFPMCERRWPIESRYGSLIQEAHRAFPKHVEFVISFQNEGGFAAGEGAAADWPDQTADGKVPNIS